MNAMNHQPKTRMRRVGWLAAMVYFASLSGCLNPAFINGLSGGSVVPIAPGDTPYIHVLFINASSTKTFKVQLGWTPEYQGLNSWYIWGIEPGAQTGVVLGCPINQVGLGDPSDLTLPAIEITEEGSTVNVPAGAFPLTLQNGEDYVCGDTVVFTLVDDRNNGYGINVSPGRVDGSTQGGPFTGPDTFQLLQLLQYSGGVPPIPVP